MPMGRQCADRGSYVWVARSVPLHGRTKLTIHCCEMAKRARYEMKYVDQIGVRDERPAMANEKTINQPTPRPATHRRASTPLTDGTLIMSTIAGLTPIPPKQTQAYIDETMPWLKDALAKRKAELKAAMLVAAPQAASKKSTSRKE